MPGDKPEIVVVAPVPETAPGLIVHVPVGKPLSTTLPVGTKHVGCVINPITGAVGLLFTVNVYVATAAEHGEPNGLLVVTVIVTVFPASPANGV